ncbi:50S ribosomal protein L7/L12 [Micromonospora chalcea]|uniref:50S ribosomal protein L7/L12 n=1 Tax=Micromonospora chalcea TaxID=1874 RepID=UPI0037B6D1C5
MSPAVQIALAVALVVVVFLLLLVLRRDRPRDLVAPDRPAGGQAEVLRLIHAGRRVEAVKLLREQTGLSLLEAKQAVDALAAGGSWSPGPPAPGKGVDDAVRAEAARLLHRGEKIQAIKVVREHTHMSLADAKRYVEGL